MISWILCAFKFPNKKKYDIFLVDNLHFMPVFMKIFRLIGRNQKIVAHMGSHTLYFIYSHRFSKLNEWMHIQALKRYDALICEGKMAEFLVRKILNGKTPLMYTVFMGIPDEHYPSEENIMPDLSGRNILFIGNGPDEFRSWYKGLDLIIAAFKIAFLKDPLLKLTIVGNWDEKIRKELTGTVDMKIKNSIIFTGEAKNLSKFTSHATLYLHCARGEAFGITILIAMAAGVPALVSDWTGAKEVVEQVDGRLIVPLDARIIAEKIIWYFNLPISEKEKLSVKGKNIARVYTEKNAIDYYKATFNKLIQDSGVVK
ncbi:MAG: glycosyltransferase family 4 protein [Bacteroidetes bacterium]|nr:glycosyltransferase family 4 protein [Bacteroidota bacterium]